MIKKTILCALALSLLIPISVSAQALTTGAKPATQAASTQKNSARAPYASQIKSERQTIKANYDTNQAIRDAIKAKLAQVKTLIAQDKASKTLKSKKLDLKSDRAAIKTSRATLKGINTNLKADRQSVKTDKASKDYATLVNDLNKIPSLQTSKTPVLQKISSDLDSIISLLK